MAERLAKKVALITGGARGQGEAESRLFAAEGASVVIADVLDREGAALAEAINLRVGTEVAVFAHLDVASADEWGAAIATAGRVFGGLDILVNNAGISGRPGIESMPLDEWDRVLGVNQTGTLLGIRAAVPAMRIRGGGAIVNISSIYGLIGAAVSPAYQATKGAIRMLSRAAALEYAVAGIRVNSVLPGLVDTPMTARLAPEVLSARLARTPMQRQARPEEIAYAALYLASDEASFVTGAELVVDGGYTAG